jgi:hypothetical protein
MEVRNAVSVQTCSCCSGRHHAWNGGWLFPSQPSGRAFHGVCPDREECPEIRARKRTRSGDGLGRGRNGFILEALAVCDGFLSKRSCARAPPPDGRRGGWLVGPPPRPRVMDRMSRLNAGRRAMSAMPGQAHCRICKGRHPSDGRAATKVARSYVVPVDRSWLRPPGGRCAAARLARSSPAHRGT